MVSSPTLDPLTLGEELRVVERNSACTDCELYQFAKHVCLMGEGPVPARGMVVGEGPGSEEDETGRPFCGRAGELLDKTLMSVGLSRGDLFVTNATRCKPPSTNEKTLLVKKAIKPCRKYLDKELAAVKPEVILLLGAAALQTFTGRQDVTKKRGSEFFDEDLNAWVVITVHPAYVLRDPRQEQFFKADIQRFARRLRGEDARTQPTVHICDTIEKVDEAFAALAPYERISFDLETKSLEEWRPDSRLWMIGLAAKADEAWVIPFEHPQAPWGTQHVITDVVKVAKNGAKLKRQEHTFIDPHWKGNREWLHEELKSFLKSKKLIGHNVKFDLRWLARYGIEVDGYFDTMLAAHLLDENRTLNLAQLSQTDLGALAWGKGEIKFDPPDSLDVMATYCGIDAANAFGLFEKYAAQLVENQRLARLFKTAIMPALNVYKRGEVRGFWVDDLRLKEEEKAIRAELAEIEGKIRSMVPDGSNIDSTNFLREWLFESPDHCYTYPEEKIGAWTECECGEYRMECECEREKTEPIACEWKAVHAVALGLTPVKLTPIKKDPSTDSDSLEQLAGQHEAIDLLLERAGLIKLLQFFSKWGELLDEEHRLHPSFNLSGTDTGRRSCSNPNLMQVPKAHRARSVIGAPPGWKLLSADYSQIELRIVAHLSQDPTMLKAYRRGVDLHSLTAAWVSRKLPDDVLIENVLDDDEALKEVYSLVTEDDRFKAKALNFGLLYGMGTRGLREYARRSYKVDMTEEEALAAYNAFFALYPSIKRWQNRQRQMAGGVESWGKTIRKADLQVESPLGRIRRLPHIKSGDRQLKGLAERQSMNAPVQAFPPDLVLIALSELEFDDSLYFLGDVHDSVLMEIREDQLTHWLPLIHTALEKPPLLEKFGVELSVPLVVDWTLSDRWGEKEFSSSTHCTRLHLLEDCTCD